MNAEWLLKNGINSVLKYCLNRNLVISYSKTWRKWDQPKKKDVLEGEQILFWRMKMKTKLRMVKNNQNDFWVGFDLMLTSERSWEIITIYCMLGYEAVKDCGICIWLQVLNLQSVLGTVLTFTNDSSRSSVEYLFRWGCHIENYKANNSPSNALISSRCQNHLFTFRSNDNSKSMEYHGVHAWWKSLSSFALSVPWWDHISYLLFTSPLFNNAGGVWVSS